jgi:HrpA-like RNA helicase
MICWTFTETGCFYIRLLRVHLTYPSFPMSFLQPWINAILLTSRLQQRCWRHWITATDLQSFSLLWLEFYESKVKRDTSQSCRRRDQMKKNSELQHKTLKEKVWVTIGQTRFTKSYWDDNKNLLIITTNKNWGEAEKNHTAFEFYCLGRTSCSQRCAICLSALR